MRKWKKSELGPGFYSYEDNYFKASVEKRRSKTWSVRVFAEGRVQAMDGEITMKNAKKFAEEIMDLVIEGRINVKDWPTMDEHMDVAAKMFLRGIAG